MAFTSFDVLFDSSIPGTSTESTGVKGKMTFNFKKDIDGKYTLDLDIFNTSPVTGDASGNLVGFAFNVPGKNNTPSDIEILSYDPLDSPFEKGLEPGDFSPFGSFSFCARNSGNKCVGGQAKDNGLLGGKSSKVTFKLASNVTSINTAEEVSQSFINLFSSWNPALSPKTPQVALRFQQVGDDGEGSEKVGGIPKKPPQAPGDPVPGPLPLLGAVTAFGFSRKLRRRISVADSVDAT